MHRNRYHAPGFTLIELMIVIVIVGLIIGGILMGQQIQESSRLANVITELQKYQRAVSLFKDSHGSYPGDMPDAYKVWACATDAAAPTGCNGDGNEQIQYSTEGARAWQHLELAEMIQDRNYTGTFASGTIGVPGTNMPISEAFDAGYYFSYQSSGNWIFSGRYDGTGEPNLEFLTPNQAEIIDSKIDDGNANTGRFQGIQGSGLTDCYTGGSKIYNLTATGVYCVIGLQLDSKF